MYTIVAPGHDGEFPPRNLSAPRLTASLIKMSITRLRPVFLLALLVTLLISLGLRMGERDTFILAVVAAVMLTAILANYSGWILTKNLPVTDLAGRDPWRVRERVVALSQRARLPAPSVYRLPWPQAQAMVLGSRPTSASVVVTDGLLEKLTAEELEAVLAYQLACIQSQATLAFTVGGALSDLVLGVGRLLNASLGWLLGTRGSFTALLAPLAGLCLRLSVGRNDYLKADRLAASWLNNPAVLAKALWKLDSYSNSEPIDINPASAPFYVVNPLTKRSWSRYFRTHPAIEERIRSLLGYYPI